MAVSIPRTGVQSGLMTIPSRDEQPESHGSALSLVMSTSTNVSHNDDATPGCGLLEMSSLPNEILVNIISCYDRPSPFHERLTYQPLLSNLKSTPTPLKKLSLLSHRLRLLTLPLLFRHSTLNPYHLTPYLAFVKTHKLQPHIRSVVAYLSGPCSHIHPAWWARLLNVIPITTVSILAAPHIFAELTGVSMCGTDTWAFNMPYQSLTLQCTSKSAQELIPYNDIPNILISRPWTSLTVNEGSSLKAYTTYEYFLRTTPSLLTALHHHTSTFKTFSPATSLFSKLDTFSFIAIFPFYNHVDEILKCVRLMTSLTRLSIKLCPDPDSTVLNDEIEQAMGHIDVNDPWNEFDTSITLVAHTVIFLTLQGKLEELRVDDVKMEGIRDTVERGFNDRLQKWWKYDGQGIWVKESSDEENKKTQQQIQQENANGPVQTQDMVFP